MTAKIKTLILKNCHFYAGYNGTLEEVFRQMIASLPNHDDRVYQVDMLKKLRVATVDDILGGGVFVRIVALDENPVGLVNLKKSTSTLGVDEHAPPTDHQWLNEDIMLYVHNNSIISCGLGSKDRLLENLVYQISVNAEVLGKDTKFLISDVANKNEIEKINRIGVKSIDFSITSYLNSLGGIQTANPLSTLAMDALEAVFGVVNDKNALEKRSNIEGRLVLTRKGKFQNDEIPKSEWMQRVGTAIVNQDDSEYTITLEDGTKISTNKLKITRSVKIKSFANTVCPERTKYELQQFHGDLLKDGTIDQ